MDEHLHHLRTVLRSLRHEKLYAQPAKWQFIQDEVAYCGQGWSSCWSKKGGGGPRVGCSARCSATVFFFGTHQLLSKVLKELLNISSTLDVDDYQERPMEMDKRVPTSVCESPEHACACRSPGPSSLQEIVHGCDGFPWLRTRCSPFARGAPCSIWEQKVICCRAIISHFWEGFACCGSCSTNLEMLLIRHDVLRSSPTITPYFHMQQHLPRRQTRLEWAYEFIYIWLSIQARKDQCRWFS